MYTDFSDIVTNAALPKTAATLTLRVIKSFQYRTQRSLILRNVNLETTTIGELKDLAHEAVRTQPGWKPYRNVTLGLCSERSLAVETTTTMPQLMLVLHLTDTLKLYTVAHGAKTTNLIINLDHDDWIFDDNSKTLAELGFENETEVSFFNRQMYDQFKVNPETLWDT